jgi:hypothetical protein
MSKTIETEITVDELKAMIACNMAKTGKRFSRDWRHAKPDTEMGKFYEFTSTVLMNNAADAIAAACS